MGVPNKLAQFLGKIAALGISCAAVALNPSASMSMPHQAKPAALSGIENVEEQRGPFAIGEQNYTVLMHFKRLATAANDPFAQSLAGLEIRDAAGTVTYEKRFPFAVAASRFELPVAVSVERLSGSTGAGLIIHYTELAGASEVTHSQANESWQLFGIVNGKLAPLPQPAVIGEPNLGGPYM